MADLPPPSRTFVDSVGVRWIVREIRPSAAPPRLAKLLGSVERRSPWLVFESDEGEKRRLAPVPDGWAGLSDFVIERWCMRAKHVPPAPERRAADRADPGARGEKP